MLATGNNEIDSKNSNIKFFYKKSNKKESQVDPRSNYSPKFEQLIENGLASALKNGWISKTLDIMRSYTKLSSEGLENIPRKGPVILVPNHSGVWGWDGMVLQNEVLKQVKRIPRTMLHNFWFKNPNLKIIAEQLGFIPQDFKMALKLLKKNKLLLLFPEAESGNFKPSTKMYQINYFNPGFVSLAILSNATIVPCCVLGAEETHLNFGTLNFVEKWFGIKIPLPVNFIPLPIKWKLIFLKGVNLSKYNKKDSRNQAFILEVTENIRMRIQQRINKELVKRKRFTFIWDS